MTSANLPADSYVDDGARTRAEMKIALEAIRDFLAMQPGALATEVVQISAGVVTASSTSVLIIESETGSADDLVQLGYATPPTVKDGFKLLLRAKAGHTITITHTVATSQKFELHGGVDFVLTGNTRIQFVLQGGSWQEVRVDWDTGNAAQRVLARDSWALGDVATMDIGAGNGIDADLLDGLEGSAYRLASAPAGDATTLDSLDSLDYMQLDPNGISGDQRTKGNLGANGGVLTANNPSSSATIGLQLRTAGNDRARVEFDDSLDTFDLVTYNASFAITSRIRIKPNTGEIDWNPDFAADSNDYWPIWTGKNGGDQAGSAQADAGQGTVGGLNADSVDGAHLSANVAGHSTDPIKSFHKGTHTGSIPTSSYTELYAGPISPLTFAWQLVVEVDGKGLMVYDRSANKKQGAGAYNNFVGIGSVNGPETSVDWTIRGLWVTGFGVTDWLLEFFYLDATDWKEI